MNFKNFLLAFVTSSIWGSSFLMIKYSLEELNPSDIAIYRILIGKEKLPESARRSKIMRKETYIDKVYAQAINKFNKSNLDG